MSYQVNHIPDSILFDLARRIVYYKACNPNQLINGDAGERLLAESWGLPYVKRHSLDDMNDGVYRAYSNKVRYVSDVVTEKSVDLKLTTRFPKESVLALSPQQIASVYFKVWIDLVEKTKTDFPDLRTLILLLDKSHLSFSVYEYPTHTWKAEDYDWRWSADSEDMTTVHGFCRDSGERMFAIHLNDSRLFVKQKIGVRQSCLLPPTDILCMNKALKTVGFDPDAVVKLPREEEPNEEMPFGNNYFWMPPAVKLQQRKDPVIITDKLSFLS